MDLSKKIRLHKALITQLKKYRNYDYSKPEIQNNIAKYGVMVDERLVFNRLQWVSELQTLSISHWPLRPKGNLEGIKILEENKDFLVIFKPPNLAVQPGTGHQKDNLLSWLLQYYPEQTELLYQSSFFGDKRLSKEIINPTAGIVHRLDKDAQGLLLVARSLSSLDFLQDQFRSRSVTKKYLTIVTGILNQKIRIRAYQARSNRNPVRQILFWTETEALKYDSQVRQNDSIFKPIATCKESNQTLVEVQIFTGRMHQIRLQAESIGYPIFSDKIYNQTKTIPKKFLSQLTDDLNPTLQIEKIPDLQDLGQYVFERLKQKIFGDVDFCLLSNELHFTTPDRNKKDLVLFDLESISSLIVNNNSA